MHDVTGRAAVVSTAECEEGRNIDRDKENRAISGTYTKLCLLEYFIVM